MNNGLNIKVITDKFDQSKFDASFGSLVLPEADSFKITVQEYADEYNKNDKKYEEDKKFAENKWKERTKEGWSKEKLNENWEANKRERVDSYKKITKKFRRQIQRGQLAMGGCA